MTEPTPSAQRKPHRRFRRLSIVLAVVAVVLVMLVIALELGTAWYVNHRLRPQLLEAAHEACPKCTLEIPDIQFSLLRGTLAAVDIKYLEDPSSHGPIGVGAHEIRARGSVCSYLSGVLRIDQVELIGPWLHVTDTPLVADPHPGPNPRSFLLGLPAMVIERVDIQSASILITQKLKGQDARFELDEIDAEVVPVVTRPELEARGATMKATALVSKSGRLTFAGKMEFFSELGDALYELWIRNMEIENANTWFLPSDGIELRGRAKLLHGKMQLAAGKLDGVLDGEWEGVGFRVKPTKERGVLIAAAVNAGDQLLTARHTDGRPSVPIRGVRTHRDSYMPFLLKRLASSAIDLSRKNH